MLLFASQLQNQLTESRIHSSFAGSFPCQHYRLDWAIQRVRDKYDLFELIDL